MTLTLNQKLLILGKLYAQCQQELNANYMRMGYSGAYSQQLATEQCDLVTKGGAKNKVITATPLINQIPPRNIGSPLEKK